MEENTLEPREHFEKNLKTYTVFSIIVPILVFLTVGFTATEVNNLVLPIMGICLFLPIYSIITRKRIGEELKMIQKRLIVLLVVTLTCSIFLLIESYFSGIMFVMPFYAISLLRDLHRLENYSYDEKNFWDKLLKFCEVLMWIIIVMAGIITAIYTKVVTENRNKELIEQYIELEKEKNQQTVIEP